MGHVIYGQNDVVLDLAGGTLGGYRTDTLGGPTVLSIAHSQRVTIRNGTIDGALGGLPWSEHHHCIRVLNSSTVLLENLHLINIAGDGVLIGDGSRDVLLQNTHGKGTNIGRNFISIICGETIRIEDCSSLAVSRPGMPGGVDIEPDWPEEYVRNVAVVRTTINAGAGGALFGFGIANHLANTPHISGIVFEDCVVNGPFNAGFAYYGSTQVAEHPPLAVRPTIRNCKIGFLELDGGKFSVSNPTYKNVERQRSDDKRRRRKKKRRR